MLTWLIRNWINITIHLNHGNQRISGICQVYLHGNINQHVITIMVKMILILVNCNHSEHNIEDGKVLIPTDRISTLGDTDTPFVSTLC